MLPHIAGDVILTSGANFISGCAGMLIFLVMSTFPLHMPGSPLFADHSEHLVLWFTPVKTGLGPELCDKPSMVRSRLDR